MRALTLSVVLSSAMIIGAMGLMGNQLNYALPIPANHTITTKLTDTLKSITSNVSTSIQSDIDKSNIRYYGYNDQQRNESVK